MFFQEFSYELEHRAGTKMKHVDALSRVFCLVEESSLILKLRETQKTDQLIKAITAVLGQSSYDDFYLNNGILYNDQNKELIVIPKQMEDEIISIARRQAHCGAAKRRDIIEINILYQT